MRQRLVPALIAACVVAVGLVALASGGEDPYRIRLQLDNAGGLRQGSDVAIGGVRVGEVQLDFDDRDRVVADLRIDRQYAPLGKDVTAAISAVNLLGAKRVDLTSGGDAVPPAPDGFRVPASRVTESTDLDQVLNVLAPETRTRLAVLISEAGLGVKDRGSDLNQILQILPPSLKDSTVLADALVRDNTTLARLVTSSDGVVNEITRKRAALARVVHAGAEAAETIGSRHRQLGATLDRAPGALRTLQRFLNELERTTVPLAPAARDIRRVAPELSRLLDHIEPFGAAARPALATATGVAPRLTRLADGATPVLRQAVPTLQSLATTSAELAPVSRTLDRSADNLIATLHNWSRAIQFRDSASHVFRGQPSFSPDALETVIRRLLPDARRKRKQRTPAQKAPQTPSAQPGPSAPSAPPALPKLPKLPDLHLLLPKVTGGLQDTLKGLPDRLTPIGPKAPADSPSDATSLLDFLLKP